MLSLDTMPSGTVKYSIYDVIMVPGLFGARHLQRAWTQGHEGVLLVEQTLQCAALRIANIDWISIIIYIIAFVYFARLRFVHANTDTGA